MKRILPSIILLFCFAVNVHAQGTFQWGPPNVLDNKNGAFDKIIGTNDAGLFILRKSEDKFARSLVFLERYDNTGKLVFSKEITPRWDNTETLSYRQILMVKGRLCLFSLTWVKKDAKTYAYMQEVSNDGEINPDKKELDNMSADKALNYGNYHFAVSPDGSKVFCFREEMYQKDGNEKVAFKVFDGDFKELWSKVEELPFETSHYGRNTPYVDNNGNAYLLKKVKVKFSYDYYAISEGAAPVKLGSYKIELGEKTSTNQIEGAIDPANNSFVVAGLYNEANDDTRSNGWYYLRVDASKGMMGKGKSVYTPDFLGHYMSQSAAEKGKSVGGFKLIAVLPKQDGNVLLLTERYEETKEIKVSAKDNKFQTKEDYNYTYNFTDIGVFNIKNDGTLGWNTVIKKEQKTKVDGGTFSSFVYTLSGNNLVILYSDAQILYEKHGVITQEVMILGPDHYYPVTMVQVNDAGQSTATDIPDVFRGTMFKMNLAPVVFMSHNNELYLFSENLAKTRYAVGKMKM